MPEDDEVAGDGRDRAGVADSAAPTRDEYGVGRLLALSDGVFAVAMTLLIVNLNVPPAPAHATSAEGLRALQHQLRALGIFAFSYVMVSVYWLNHHRGLRRLRVANRGVLFRNLWLLCLVCLMPFVTAFFQRFSNTTAGNQVYLGALFLLALLSALTVPWREQAETAAREPGGRRRVAAIYLRQVGDLPVFALGFVLAFWVPGDAALVVLCLIVLVGLTGLILVRGLREPLPDPDPYGVGRMLALSDDVFAIALTLLVLNVGVSEIGATGNQAALALLGRERSRLVAFVITFAVIGIYWTAHHRALRSVTSVRDNIMRRNLVILFAICLVPFVMDFFDAWNDTVFGNQFFFAAIGIIGALIWLFGPGAARMRAGLRGGWREARPVASVIVAGGAVPVSLLGIVLAPLLGPGNVQLVWLLMAPMVVVERILSGEAPRAGAR
ncbi:MAG: DUF1211 domain-containing protein [Candidatus Dormibacteraeota bacterium]|nr:DUF1211 domain-containing protein [Candidatus Dormibacteraeota bacterium]